LVYVIKYVADMDRAVRFHRDTLGLPLKFQSPFWTEFSTGDITLALHPASDRNPPGHCQLGFRTDGLSDLYANRDERGLVFSAPPAEQRGALIARLLDSEGAECSVSG
jgi:catechol 2,3-dioxygenase-like lactoylglutathione lyase family enzyme